jgi:hypothetical protein
MRRRQADSHCRETSGIIMLLLLNRDTGTDGGSVRTDLDGTGIGNAECEDTDIGTVTGLGVDYKVNLLAYAGGQLE